MIPYFFIFCAIIDYIEYILDIINRLVKLQPEMVSIKTRSARLNVKASSIKTRIRVKSF